MSKKAVEKVPQDRPAEENKVVSVQSALLEIVQRNDIEPERLEKFLDLQIKMEERQAEQDLNVALTSFQKECPPIPKTKKGHNSKYAPLDEMATIIQPFTSKYGLSYSFSVRPFDKELSILITTVRHINGGRAISEYYFPSTDMSGSKNASQGVKSALSYAKRAGLENALGLVTKGDDSDGDNLGLQAEPNALKEIKTLVKKSKSDEPKLLKFLGAKSLETLTQAQANKAIHALKQKVGG